VLNERGSVRKLGRRRLPEHDGADPGTIVLYLEGLTAAGISLGVYLWFESRERRRLEAEIQALDSLKH
jgi:hypothetical protein